ncbi:unnamed protein product [Diamesa tonsa]
MNQFLWTCVVFLVISSSLVISAPLQKSKILSSITANQRKFINSAENEKDSIKLDEPEAITNDDQEDEEEIESSIEDDSRERLFYRRDELLGEYQRRQNKMIGFLPFGGYPMNNLAYSAPAPPPFYYPSEFYEDFESFYGYGGMDEEEEIMSRQSQGGHRRRPAAAFKNSPIFYIRLPPTPYMFVPGLGYISQPPTYQPLAPIPPPVSPFYNVPLNFLANGKPTNVYQWGGQQQQQQQQSQYGPQFGAPQPQYVQQQQPQYISHQHQQHQQHQQQHQQPQYGGYPSYQRPQRPYQRPINPINPNNPFIRPDSKVTHLKGPFLFNGRPEEIFLLQNSYNSIYPDPRFSSNYY